jgi:hypothetical protein
MAMLDQLGRNVEDFRLALDDHGNLKLRVQVYAIGTMTVGAATSAFAFDKGARKNLDYAQRCESALPL